MLYCLYSDKEELMKLQNNGSERKAQLMELKRKTEEAVKTSIKDYEMNKNALLDVYSHLKEKVGVSVNVKTTLNFKYYFLLPLTVGSLDTLQDLLLLFIKMV